MSHPSIQTARSYWDTAGSPDTIHQLTGQQTASLSIPPSCRNQPRRKTHRRLSIPMESYPHTSPRSRLCRRPNPSRNPQSWALQSWNPSSGKPETTPRVTLISAAAFRQESKLEGAQVFQVEISPETMGRSATTNPTPVNLDGVPEAYH